MIEIFFKLVDTLIALLKEKQIHRDKVFQEVVEPLYKEMAAVVNDYFLLFREADVFAREAVDEISNDSETLSPEYHKKLEGAIEKLRNHREEFLSARIQIREMANLIQEEFHDDHIREFAERILKFFFSSEVHHQPRLTYGTYIVELFTLLEEGSLTAQTLRLYLNDARRNLETNWAEVTRAYARLKIDYSGVPKNKALRSPKKLTSRDCKGSS